MTTTRIAIAEPQPQGKDEAIYWGLDVTRWGSSPTDAAVTVYQDGSDVTADVTTGSPTVAGNIITLPQIHSLTAGLMYRVEVAFTVGDNDLETHWFIDAEE